MEKIRLKLLTPTRSLLDLDVAQISLPTQEGILGIRPGHTPLVVGLSVGLFEVFALDGKIERFFVSGGFAEISNSHVSALVELAEASKDLDLQRALSSEQRAKERLLSKADRDLDIPRALASLARAKARQRLAVLENQERK